MFKVPTRTLYETGWRKRQADARAKGECGKYVGRGRFAEKGGGQQVASAFLASVHNERIKAIYGNYCFWSWLRYWFIDSKDYLEMIMLDKGYYDYDFEDRHDYLLDRLKKLKPKSDEELQQKFTALGLGNVMACSKPTAEELQQQAMRNT